MSTKEQEAALDFIKETVTGTSLKSSGGLCGLRLRFSSSWFFLFCFGFGFYKFIYLFLAASGLRCCAWALSSCGEQGLLFVVVRGLLIAVASLVAEHGL